MALCFSSNLAHVAKSDAILLAKKRHVQYAKVAAPKYWTDSAHAMCIPDRGACLEDQSIVEERATARPAGHDCLRAYHLVRGCRSGPHSLMAPKVFVDRALHRSFTCPLLASVPAAWKPSGDSEICGRRCLLAFDPRITAICYASEDSSSGLETCTLHVLGQVLHDSPSSAGDDDDDDSTILSSAK